MADEYDDDYVTDEEAFEFEFEGETYRFWQDSTFEQKSGSTWKEIDTEKGRGLFRASVIAEEELDEQGQDPVI